MAKLHFGEFLASSGNAKKSIEVNIGADRQFLRHAEFRPSTEATHTQPRIAAPTWVGLLVKTAPFPGIDKPAPGAVNYFA